MATMPADVRRLAGFERCWAVKDCALGVGLVMHLSGDAQGLVDSARQVLIRAHATKPPQWLTYRVHTFLHLQAWLHFAAVFFSFELDASGPRSLDHILHAVRNSSIL